MQQMNRYAFVGEYGTNSPETDKQGVSSHFVVCALLVEESIPPLKTHYQS